MALDRVAVSPTDHELINRAQHGDASAFEQLVCRYDHTVLAIAASYTNDEDDAKDIYQEVFLRVYRSLSGFEFRSEFSTWLYRVVTNVCISHLRRNRGRAFTTIDDDFENTVDAVSRSTAATSESPDQLAQDADIGRHIDNALDALSPQQRLVFTLRHYEGYKLKEIASMMDCAEGTVKKYLFTAMDRLRRQLKKVF
jgi:RNA polymerase sigma-70 factor (ECF subfamily)